MTTVLPEVVEEVHQIAAVRPAEAVVAVDVADAVVVEINQKLADHEKITHLYRSDFVEFFVSPN